MAEAPAAGGSAVLEVRNLVVTVSLPGGRRVPVVNDVSFSIPAGGSMGLVGESGSGKTMTSLAIMGLLPPAVRVESGEILFEGAICSRRASASCAAFAAAECRWCCRIR